MNFWFMSFPVVRQCRAGVRKPTKTNGPSNYSYDSAAVTASSPWDPLGGNIPHTVGHPNHSRASITFTWAPAAHVIPGPSLINPLCTSAAPRLRSNKRWRSRWVIRWRPRPFLTASVHRHGTSLCAQTVTWWKRRTRGADSWVSLGWIGTSSPASALILTYYLFYHIKSILPSLHPTSCCPPLLKGEWNSSCILLGMCLFNTFFFKLNT